jgi:beta-glucosidase
MGDGPAGVGNSLDNVTTFPAPVTVAASWNTSLQFFYGQALAQEHKTKARNVVLAPTINILRSPSWARSAETLGEDPFLTSAMAVASVLGIQSQDMVACPKHFAAYNQDTNRFGLDPVWDAYDAIIDERVLHEVYLPAFKAAVQKGNAGSVMCSYNKLNGEYACQNKWLLDVLKKDWGFTGFVVADWYFGVRSTVDSAVGGLDISMPGGSLESSYGFPAYYGDLLIEAVDNGSVPFARIDDMVARLWRPLFEFGVVDAPVLGNSTAVARTQAHLDLALEMALEGIVLLKNEDSVLPLSASKYKSIAVFGADATNLTQISENHGGFVIDSTTVVKSPLHSILTRGQSEGINVSFAEAYPGTQEFTTVPSEMFVDGVNVTYWTTTDFSGPINQTQNVPNITAATYPEDLWVAYPQVFSAEYTGSFMPNTSGLYHFSLTGQGNALFYISGELIANMTDANFGCTIQGIANLTAGVAVPMRLHYSMGYSLSTGAYGITLGVDVGNLGRDAQANALAAASDLSIIFVSDRDSEGLDNFLGLSLPGDQDALISRLAKLSKHALVVLQTNSAILMPWLDEVDAVMEAWYGGQQIGLALEALLFGDVNPSGKLPVTFPTSLNDTIQYISEVEVHFDEGLYVGYKWYDKHNIDPLFAFGYGLSYTKFEIAGISMDIIESAAWSSISDSVAVTTTLSNTGDVDGQQVVQLYVSYPPEAQEPPKLLRGFEKVFLGAGNNTDVTILVDLDDLRIWDRWKKDWRLVAGNYTFKLGFSATEILLQTNITLGY